MCKVLILTNGAKIKRFERVVNHVAELITKYDNDGFGYAALGKQGVFGERSTSKNPKSRLSNLALEIKEPFVSKTHEIFGTPDSVIGPVLLHGRTSTNVLGLKNTHPITRNNWALIHNGVVTNNGPSYPMQTDNDTEHLVHYLSTQGMKGIESNLSGYFAFGAIDNDGKLHVSRCTRAPLVAAWIESIHSFVFATTADLIEDLCEKFKWTYGPLDNVKDNQYIVFKGNNVLSIKTHAFKGYLTQRESILMAKSLHYLEGDSKVETYGHVYDGSNDNDEITDIDNYTAYIEALDYVDGACKIYDQRDFEIDAETFRRMSDDERLRCTVYLPDGSLLTPSRAKVG
jgi:predicted glutamine amidotransferase